MVSFEMLSITKRIASELLMSLMLLPLMYTDLRLRTEGTVAATDASGSAGGICRSDGLSRLGKEELEKSMEFVMWAAMLEFIIADQTPEIRNLNA